MPSGGLRPAIVLAVIAVVGLGAWTAYYTVPSDSVAVVQRFGKYLKDVPPGLHFKLPLGVDVATIVPVKRQLKQEFGFATSGATDPYQISRDGKRETQMVTGDLNAVLVEWVVQYRISDPVKFLFDVREPRGTLRDVSESVMREVVGDRTVDQVITIGRQEIETEALAKMQALSTKYVMGISIDQVQLKNINPPEPVQVSFNEVNQAQQEKEKLINEARRDYNKVIPLAEGRRINGSAKPTATGSRGSMKRKAMLLASAPYWRNTSRPPRLPAAAFTLRPCRTSCRPSAPRSLSTSSASWMWGLWCRSRRDANWSSKRSLPQLLRKFECLVSNCSIFG